MSTPALHQTPYSKLTTAWKSLAVLLRAFGAGATAAGGVVATTDLPPETAGLFAVAIWGAGIVEALWKAIENVRKNFNDDGTPLWVWPWNVQKSEVDEAREILEKVRARRGEKCDE